jgi:hypothetical protein
VRVDIGAPSSVCEVAGYLESPSPPLGDFAAAPLNRSGRLAARAAWKQTIDCLFLLARAGEWFAGQHSLPGLVDEGTGERVEVFSIRSFSSVSERAANAELKSLYNNSLRTYHFRMPNLCILCESPAGKIAIKKRQSIFDFGLAHGRPQRGSNPCGF